MNKYKYKYFMNGMIDGTDGKTYEIEVPSPFLYDSELAAMIGFSAITASNRGQGAGPLSGSRVENPGNKR